MRELRLCGWCLEAESSVVATLGEIAILMCDPCVESLGSIPDRVVRCRWAKGDNDDAESR